MQRTTFQVGDYDGVKALDSDQSVLCLGDTSTLELDGLLNNEVTRENLSQSVYDICQELKIVVVRMNCSLLVTIQDLQDFHVALTSLVCGLCDAGENFMGASREECMSISDSDM